MQPDPFRLSLPDAPLRRAAIVAARPLLSRLLRLETYRDLYARASALGDGPFERRALEVLGITPICGESDLRNIPSRGGVVVAANHPHGALDGLALASIVRNVRNDVRILTNHLLSCIPDLAELCFFVDPFAGPDAAARSRAGLRAAHLWLRRGGALVVFPAGEVAHECRPDGSYADGPWHATVGRLVVTTSARAVPAFIAGTNSKTFYAAGRIHPFLRTSLLARELLQKRGQSVRVAFGPPLDPASLGAASDPVVITGALRGAMERLRTTRKTSVEAMTVDEQVAVEVSGLPTASCLVESGAFRVYLTEADRIPLTLREIGRLREVTFRAAGEGTGQEVDLDRFDESYLHLFTWDRERRRIVGAYRIGRTDLLVSRYGMDALYTRTLFRYDERLLTRVSPALELGRSFVRREYQKNHAALLLLWKGIARFVALHPEYHVLFGPVSISSRYSDESQRLLTAFLEQNHRQHDLAELVIALNPPVQDLRTPPALPRSIDEVDRLVARSETDGKGVPVLLRQYLKLNACVLGFNVDPQFGDVLDALMMVDLTKVDRPILNRYFGRDAAEAFLASHPAQAA